MRLPAYIRESATCSVIEMRAGTNKPATSFESVQLAIPEPAVSRKFPVTPREGQSQFLLSVDNPAYDEARVGAGDAAGVTGFDAAGAAAFLFAAASAAAASFAST